MNNGYAFCSNRWALDKDIKTELGLLIIISSLCAEKGYCFASNKYLGDIFGLPENTISIKIKKLEEKGYIKVEYEKRGWEITKRYIRIENFQMDDLKKIKQTILENSKDNNTSINNIKENIIINNNIKEKFFENQKINDLFIEFLQQRKKLKAINSERAIKQLVDKLNQYDDLTKEQMIEESIVNSWKGVFPIKKNNIKKDEWWKKYEN